MTMRMRPKTLLISLTTAITLYALLGFLIIPAVALHLVNKQFEQRATVPARLESIKLNPFTLELTLAGLHIGEPEQPQVSFARLYANLQIDSLWTRAVHLRDVELEQASTRVQFAEDGTLNLTELFILPEASEPADDNDSGPFPLRIDRLALIGNSLQFQDLRPAEPVEFGYDAVDIELTHLSTLPDDNTLMQISASGPYGARIDWEGQLSISPLTSSGTLAINEAQLSTFWPYVQEQLPLTLNQGSLNVTSTYQLSLVESTELQLSDIRLQLSDLDLAAEDKPLLRLNSLAISDASMDLAKREVRLGAIHSEGLNAQAARLKDGQIDWLALLTPTSSTTDQSVEPPATTAPAEEDVPSVAATDTSSEPEQPWRILLNQAQLRDYRLQLTDHQPTTPVELDIGPLNLDLSEFDSQSESPFKLSIDTALNQEGQLAVSGEVGINPITADLQVETRQIDLTVAQAYIEPLMRLELRSGLLDSNVQVQLEQLEPLQLSVTGQAGVQQLHVVDGPAKRDLLKWQSLQLDDLNYAGNSLSINKVSLQQPYVRFIINRDMSTNFSDLMVPQPAAPGSAASDSSDPFGIRIGGVSINNGSANFADFSLTPNFATGIEQLNGSIGTLDNQSKKAAAVDLNGKVDRYAPVTIKGRLTPFDPLNSLDIATSFKNVELTTLTPYSGKFAGYRIRKGRLNLDLHYQIDEGQLKADNRVLLEDLQLGERVDSPDAVDLPIRLAVALLKDTKGNIDIELPVAGDLNNPEFSVMPIVWQTLRNLMLRATQAPFKFIAGLAGAGEADLSELSFAAGSAELDDQATKVLGTLSSALQERPQLILEVEGISATSADGPPLATQRLEREMRLLAASTMRRPPDNPAELELDDRDQIKLIRKLHEQRQLSLPEQVLELPREERDRAMRQALIDSWSDNSLPLRRLAQQRASAIKDWLVDQGGLEAERIHLLDASEGTADGSGKVATQLQLGVR
ncbi:protein of unknown function [Halopseudomonas bauzanensis]|uniref:DUF748 domain-containing protein n=2 Tax=Pseudomonadaceae TaxID=135621 RepID=A0A1H9WQL5_9GAMM|nr:protein of unknown function [Halopseudomonas bauzanensis]SFM37869.1 protein of unknown function [Halopseudomonas bauzanensis]